MQDIIDKYLKSEFGDIETPNDEGERIKLARALFGLSLVNSLDYWLTQAKDYLDNDKPKEPFHRDNEFSRKDKYFRDAFSKLDNETREVVIDLINSTITGFAFSVLTNFDQFDFGKLILLFKPKSKNQTEISISSEFEDLHDDLSEWIYHFSRYKDDIVEKEENSTGTYYRLK